METRDMNDAFQSANGYFGGHDENPPSEKLTRRDFFMGPAKWPIAMVAVFLLTRTQGLLLSSKRNHFPPGMAAP